MKKTGFLYDERFLLHDTGSYHPEIADRLPSILKGIEAAGLLPQLKLIRAQLVDKKWVEAVHEREYIYRLEKACRDGKTMFDCPDNAMCPKTYETALLAVGGIIETARLVMAGELDNAFCAVRPPGHHAERAEAMGFCYFNNVAITARYLQQEWDMAKIGIVDFDVHHGNGTQHIFERDDSVFYYSIHEHPTFAYPGTGREFEYGRDAGYGFTKNSPVLPGRGDEDYKRLMSNDLFPAFASFQPDFVLVSAGFDAHVDDNMSDMRLSTAGFSWIMKKIVEMAAVHSQGRIISVLEGGYSIKRLPELAKNHIEILLDMVAKDP